MFRREINIPCFVLHYGVLAISALAVTATQGQIQQQAHTLNGSGRSGSNTQFVVQTSTSQNQAVGMSQSTTHRAHMGFLNSFIIHPDADADGDGIADENDTDDDGDRLSDAAEIAGSAFNPQTPTDSLHSDSDGDGMSDGAESVSGSNPLDSDSRLVITHIQQSPNGTEIAWQGRGGRQYDLVSARDVSGLNSTTQVLARVTASGGIAPWFETTLSSTNIPIHPREMYRVRVREP